MSHTTEIDAVEIIDIAALKAAVNELAASGINCQLVENAVPRAYYNDQLPQAEYVLKLSSSDYDIGFYKRENGKGYNTRCDFFNNKVQNVLGATRAEGEDAGMAKLGKLYQTYAIHAATHAAVQQGYSVQRVNQPSGAVQLVVSGV